MATGGQRVVEQIRAEGVERIFCVPGESFLAVMDAMYDQRGTMRLISCRHESGAAMMAVASGHLTGEPGVAFVTRGPGATNASIAVHIARQGSIPLVLGVGQVTRRDLGRESFQEIDYEAYFAPIAKHVRQVQEAQEIPAAVADAFACARHGRQGPVVLAFPEDVLTGPADAAIVQPRSVVARSINPAELRAADFLLHKAQRPLIIVGGGPWSALAREQLQAFAGERGIPVMSAFRRADIFDNNQPSYAGFLGFGAPPYAWEILGQADCLFAIGTRLDEPTTQDYTFPRADQSLIHIHPEARQLGLNFATDIGIEATVDEALAGLSALPAGAREDWARWCDSARARYTAESTPVPSAARLDLAGVMQVLNDSIEDDAIITTDAGNHTAWPLRYRRYARPGRLIAPINGAMGYGVPAAIAASLLHPERTVVGFVGDGGMLMTGMEIASAVKYGATPILLVFNNSRYGTIEMHQQRQYPGREIGNTLVNPDFAAFARTFGAFGTQVTSTAAFAGALEQARASATLAVIELVISEV